MYINILRIRESKKDNNTDLMVSPLIDCAIYSQSGFFLGILGIATPFELGKNIDSIFQLAAASL